MVHFSVAIITKNEEKTLPRLLASLEPFKQRGGEVCVADTGSTDNTVKIAKEWGCKVQECGDRFTVTVDKELSEEINNYFVVDGEKSIISAGEKLFDFASARNFSASMASNNMICTLDADEAYTVFDIDKIEKYIADGYEQFEYNFIFSHDQFGNPAIEFTQSKFFDRRKVKWEGIVHEVLQGTAKIKYLDQSIIRLEHWQLPGSESRSKYIAGLAHDCYFNPGKDRQSHYLGREFAWTGRPKSAIKELKRHVAMKRWPAERAQSMIFIGDSYGMINDPENQAYWYNRAFYTDSTRREALIKLARFYQHNNNKQAALTFASAALEIPFTPYYANDKRHYGAEPHEIIYWAKGWLGDITGAQEHMMKALAFEPQNQKLLDDTKYYFEYHDHRIDGWMTFEELQFLYTMAKKVDNVCEVGSWKGRSTHALLTGCKGLVTAVDTWAGSADPLDWTHNLAKQSDILTEFKNNVGHFPNLKIVQGKSAEVAKTVQDKSYDMVFIDAGHTYEEVVEDIRAWKNKAKICLCGHDYFETVWMGVVRAVDEELGGPDEVHDRIWVKWLNKPRVSIVIPTMGRPEKLHNLIKKIKENAGYDNYEVLAASDQFPPNNNGAPKMVKKLVEQSTGDLVMYLGNDCVPEKNFLQLAVFKMIREFPELDGLVGLNDGYWRNGEFATHWLASKKLLPYLGGEFFHTGYFHTGCDNELTEMCRKIGKYVWAEEAKVFHDHPVQSGFKEKDMDDVYKLAYQRDRMEHDKNLLHERSKLLGFELHENFTEPTRIPKRIFTIWLSDEDKKPEIVEKCIKTHDIPGYKHEMITLDNCYRNEYVEAAIKAKQWGKACDYLRIHYLVEEGGIYLDSDVEILENKNFDLLLGNSIFAARENNGFINTAVIGAERGSQVLKEHLKEVVSRFKGDDGLYFESSIEIFTPRVEKSDALILPSEYFYPYDHQNNTVHVTDKTIAYHHFLKSWKSGTTIKEEKV